MGFESWLPLPVVNERTMENLSLSFESLLNVGPKVIPGIRVGISPVALRMFDGAFILGSNVSN